MKIQKKNWGGGVGGRGRVGGVRVDVIEELKFLGKFKKKMYLFGGGRGGGGGVGLVGGVRVDVNKKFYKGRYFQKKKKICVCYFFHEESVHEVSRRYLIRNIIDAKFQGPKF